MLNKNHLTGTIPTEVGNAASLKVLSLSDNQLTGSIPEEIGHMNRLATCWLQNNQLTGSVPNSMSSLHSMQDFRIYENVGVRFTALSTLSLSAEWPFGTPGTVRV